MKAGRRRKALEISPAAAREAAAPPEAIADLIGSVGGLPADLSTRKKRYLRATGSRRRKRPR